MSDLKVEFDYDESKFNAENPLILPTRSDASKSKKTRKGKKSATSQRALSNKERKHKEKIQQRKIDSEYRQELWDQLKALENISATLKAADQRDKSGEIAQSKKSKKRLCEGGAVKQWKKCKLAPTEVESSGVDTDDMSSTEELEVETSSAPMEVSIVESTPVKTTSDAHPPPPDTEPPKPPSSTPQPSTVLLREPKRFVLVERTKAIVKQRSLLPVVQEEFVIMEALQENDIVFLCGGTGSGKSTQVPQFLYEAGFTRDGMRVGVTEPRRIAAISVSKRVAEELSLTDQEVSYQIRFEKTVSSQTQILFMTDGILLQELKQDLHLRRYSAVIIDEAHERSAHTDICLALLCLAVAKRRREFDLWLKRQEKMAKASASSEKRASGVRPVPLKVIIMSATLNVEELRDNPRLFGWIPEDKKPPLINVESQMKRRVIPFFNKTTPTDYVTAAYLKVCKIHREAPLGHVLVFLTGAAEVKDLCARLKATFGSEVVGDKKRTISTSSVESTEQQEHPEESGVSRACRVLPLYSALAPEKQARIFHIGKPRADRPRVIIVSTNVAETSLTIPHVMFVVDCGRVKRLVYNPVTSISSHVVDWCSRASAVQRAGRAARVVQAGSEGKRGAGRCYYLFTSYRLENEMPAFDPPEILQRPVDDVLLTIKSLWRRTPLVETHLPSLPDERVLQTAENRLLAIGALTTVTPGSGSRAPVTDITVDGTLMERIAVAPRFSRMILAARNAGRALLDHVLLLVACLSVDKMFAAGKLASGEEDQEAAHFAEWHEKRRQFVRHTWELLCGDLSVMLGTICTVHTFHSQLRNDMGITENTDEQTAASSEKDAVFQTRMMRFLESYGLTWRGYQEMEKVRRQLYHSLSQTCPEWDLQWCDQVTPPTREDLPLLRELIFTGIPFQVARKVDCTALSDKDLKRQLRWAYQTAIGEERVYIHVDSALYREKFEYVAYLDSFGSQQGKKFISGVFAIEPSWLSLHGHFYCSWSGAKTLQPLSGGAGDDSVALPRYLASVDAIVCYARQLFYGSSAQWLLHDCPLPLQRVLAGGSTVRSAGSLNNASSVWDPDRVYTRWLARFLLDGTLFEAMKKWPIRDDSPLQLLTLSVNLVRGSAINLVQALHDRQMKGKVDLINVWKNEPTYLLEEVKPWFREECHRSLTKSWPPC